MISGPLLLKHKPLNMSLGNMYSELAGQAEHIVSLASVIGFVLPPEEFFSIPSFRDGDSPFTGMIEFFSHFYHADKDEGNGKNSSQTC